LAPSYIADAIRSKFGLEAAKKVAESGPSIGNAGIFKMSDSVGSPPSNSSRSGGILQFAAKTCIIAVVLSASTLFVANWIIDRLELSVARSVGAVRAEVLKMPMDGAQFWGTIERDVAWAAEPASDLPADRKRRLINDVRVIVARWRPVVDAVATEIKNRPATDAR
jgi:hypothetical protein